MHNILQAITSFNSQIHKTGMSLSTCYCSIHLLFLDVLFEPDLAGGQFCIDWYEKPFLLFFTPL